MEASQTTTLDMESGNDPKLHSKESTEDHETEVVVQTPTTKSEEEAIPASSIEIKDGGFEAWKTVAGGYEYSICLDNDLNTPIDGA